MDERMIWSNSSFLHVRVRDGQRKVWSQDRHFGVGRQHHSVGSKSARLMGIRTLKFWILKCEMGGFGEIQWVEAEFWRRSISFTYVHQIPALIRPRSYSQGFHSTWSVAASKRILIRKKRWFKHCNTKFRNYKICYDRFQNRF